MLYEAFGWQAPVFVHLPVILDPSGKGKMSKRKPVVDGREMPVFVSDFMEGGYLPDAMFNFLTNMGWSFDAEREIFTRAEAVARFDVKDINAKATALHYTKLDWLNGVYIRQMTPARCKRPGCPSCGAAPGAGRSGAGAARSRLAELIPLIQERIKYLTDAAHMIDWAFAAEIAYPDPAQLIGKKLTPAESVAVLRRRQPRCWQHRAVRCAHELEEAFRSQAEAMQIKVGSFLAPFRVAITGRTVSPPLFESMHVLGREETLARIANATQTLRAYAAAAV